MSKSALFAFAHSIAKMKNVAYFGSYSKCFAAVLRDLYAQGYHKGGYGFQVIEPKRLWA